MLLWRHMQACGITVLGRCTLHAGLLGLVAGDLTGLKPIAARLGNFDEDKVRGKDARGHE